MKYFKPACLVCLMLLALMTNRGLRDLIHGSEYVDRQGSNEDNKLEMRDINSSDPALIKNDIPLSPEERNKVRVEKLRRLCHRRFNSTKNIEFNSLTQPWLYISHRYKFVYCNAPKVGCSSWLKVLAVLEGILNNTEDNSKGAIHNVALPMVQFLSRDQKDYVMKNYRKVMMTREPFDRTVSCYKDKFIERKGGGQPNFAKLSENVHKYYKDTNATDDRYASFQEYLKYITDLNNTYDISTHYSEPRHWEPLHTLCEPCDINYDYVLSLERAEEDAQYFLREIGAPVDLQFPNANAAKDRITNLSEYFFNATNNGTLLHALAEYYSLDYEFFDYPVPEWASIS